MKRFILLSTALIASFVLAGCGGGGGGGDDSGSAPAGNAFIQSVTSVINSANPNTSEPQNVDAIATTPDETSEPVPVATS